MENDNKSLEIPIDTEISLSMIESGCMFISLNQMTTLIIKGSAEEIRQLNNINNISFNFELIERPEFPSLGMHLEINTVSNKSFNFDYFFNTESHEDIDLLQKLSHQDHFDTLLFEEEVVYSKQIEFSKDDKLELNSLIDKVMM